MTQRSFLKLDKDGVTAIGIIRGTQAVITKPDDPCVYCYTEANTTEHIVPKSLGGNGVNNRAPACKKCNNTRGSIPLLIWLLKIWRTQ